MELPSVHVFTDYRAFLRAWFDAKKKSNPRFSHRAFVRRAGRSSPSFLADVIEGRRNLSPTAISGFCRALSLDEDEAQFFRWLVHLDQEPHPEDKRRFWEKISTTRRFRNARTLDDASFDYLAHWYHPAIREMAYLPEFRADPAWICERLQPQITEAQAHDALQTLERLGMLEVSEDGRCTLIEESVFSAPRKVGAIAVYDYHQGMVKLGLDAMARFSSQERHFATVTTAVPISMLPTLKKELDTVLRELLERCEASSKQEAPERVIQINLHFFPLSASRTAEEDDTP